MLTFRFSGVLAFLAERTLILYVSWMSMIETKSAGSSVEVALVRVPTIHIQCIYTYCAVHMEIP